MTEPYYQDDYATIYHGDSLDILPRLAAESAGLILTDPPYFRVKGDWWDRQWDTADGFLAWIGELADEWQRILAGNGSLYCFASPRMAARVEVTISERFEVLANLVWAKPEPTSEINPGAGNGGRVSKEALRSFYPNTERVIFAEQYGADLAGGSLDSWLGKLAEIKSAIVVEPLRRPMIEAAIVPTKEWSAISNPVAFAIGAKQSWRPATEQTYKEILGLCGPLPWNSWREYRSEVDKRQREYEHLRAEFEHLRRPFNVTPQDQYTDVWTFPTVADYPGKHPCEKPQAMLRHIIRASHRDDQPPILDCFAGTGSTLRAAKDLGRKAIGIELEEKYCEIAANRLAQEVLAFT